MYVINQVVFETKDVCLPRMYSFSSSYQGDQIVRLFAYWAIVFFGQFFITDVVHIIM
jgi:hypothetical protein